MTTKYKSGNGLTPSAANRPAFPSAKRYKQAIKKKSTMTMTSKLRRISGLKIQNNEKENISLTLFLQFDNFIARSQSREKGKQKFSFFASPLLKRKKKNHILKARVMQATQATTPTKLTLHLLSSNVFKIT